MADTRILNKLEKWKQKLLDLGMRNRLLNYKETKRSSLVITFPSLSILYEKLVTDEKTLTFDHIEAITNNKQQDEKQLSFSDISLDEDSIQKAIIPGDIQTNRDIIDLLQVLKNIRSRAKTILEEQGINTLFLSFGFLNWNDKDLCTRKTINSPIVLVPVDLIRKGLNEPYNLLLNEDEIVVNPTLIYKLYKDFGIDLPVFDAQKDDIDSYLLSIKKIANKSGWDVEEKVSLSLLSFSKINMYKDLENHSESISNNEIIQALSGIHCELQDNLNILLRDIENYDYDTNIAPKDSFLVVDADSSQQDAILMSKKGLSFVLQGPPGTGKSQTITNIIAEAISDGKKVLFVSEKMAALEVVYKRLTQTNLADFCLVLHSNKTNKKEILESLNKTFELKNIQTSREALAKLQYLSSLRKKLNDYCRELHSIIKPLNASIFEVNGELAQLQMIEDIIFSIDKINIRKTNQEQLNNYLNCIRDYSKKRKLLVDGYENNTWQNCNIKSVNYELRHNIQSQLGDLVKKLPTVIDDIKYNSESLNVDFDIDFSNLDNWISFFSFCSSSPFFPKELLQTDIKSLREKLLILLGQNRILLQERQYLINKYSDNIFSLDTSNIKIELESISNKIREIFNCSYSDLNSLFLNSNYIIKISYEAIDVLDNLKNILTHINEYFHIKNPRNDNEISELINLLDKCNSDIRANSIWFDSNKWDKKRRLVILEKAINLINKLKKLKNEILEEYDKEIFEIDTKLLIKFRTEYSSWWARFFKYFSYSKDINSIKALRKFSTQKLTYEIALIVLEKLKDYKESFDEFNSLKEEFSHVLGGWFEGENSDFDRIQKSFDSFDYINDYYQSDVPDYVKNILIKPIQTDEINKYIDNINKNYNDNRLINFKKDIIYSFNHQKGNDTFDKLLELACIVKDYFSSLNKTIAPIKEMNNALSLDDYSNDLNVIEHCLEIQNKIDSEIESLKLNNNYLFYQNELNAEDIINKIDWVTKFKDYLKILKISEDFQNGISNNNIYVLFSDKIESLLSSLKDRFEGIVRWFDSLFNQKERIISLPFNEIIDKASICLSRIDELEKWIDFSNARNCCYELGLDSFIDTIEKLHIDEDKLELIFKKRFYRLWLDKVLPEYKSVEGFRHIAQIDNIKEFCRLDKEQLAIARVRIREKLINAIPSSNSFTSAEDEVGILKRELSKRRKIMPIRKLFDSIPSLLSKLKPCLMMSPLSVSSILQSDRYTFDLVIFDEASQVRTENAIGAISRGKQVIVAGDIHQLPPTNFFMATDTNIDDFDNDSEETDEFAVESYESLLDELKPLFPEISLKWHYRSRNENLIAFSNYKIYDKSLITFPSPDDDNKGVDFIYVEDGLYDRSKKRNNPVEAKRVAQEVFKEIELNPNRSIGVITFSEAQQQTIENEIIRLRYSHPEFESYFNESNEEPFFVKNLENVQGDERDTIIFSIGYAKSSQSSKLAMSFGPLNRDGGYRRLNVAITRAKYSVKVVSSILPTDMDIKDSSPRGVRLLRDYLEFALNGIDYLNNENEYNDSINTESPFEDAIYNYLTQKGYELATQVGCSGYRIDMAVKHPILNNRFVLGIECDGATYHSSRTARERDRLRQAILESMGWKIYRIWSTDWIKDPISEGKRLCEVIESAINNWGEDNIGNESNLEEFEDDINKNYCIETEKITKTDFGFEPYQEIAVPYSRWAYPTETIANKLQEIIEKQYPIHIQLLYKQLAPMFGYEKVTEKVKKEIDYVIGAFGKNIWRKKDDFLWAYNRDEVKPKKASLNTNNRPVQYIALEEISEAMKVIVSCSCGINKSGLYKLLSQEYGFSRVTNQMSERFDSALNLLIKNYNYKITEDEKIVINNY